MAGEWDCEACYVRNKADVKRCVACETLKDGEVEEPAAQVSSTSSITLGMAGGFKFGGQADQPSSFGGTCTKHGSTSSPAGGIGLESGTGFGTVTFGSFLKPQKETETKEATPKTEPKKEPSGKLSDFFKAKPQMLGNVSLVKDLNLVAVQMNPIHPLRYLVLQCLILLCLVLRCLALQCLVLQCPVLLCLFPVLRRLLHLSFMEGPLEVDLLLDLHLS